MSRKGVPNKKTIKTVLAYINQYGLNVYGQCIDLETGQMFCSNMDYNADDVLKLIKLENTNKLWEQAR